MKKILTLAAAAAIMGLGLQANAQNWSVNVTDFGGFTIGGVPVFTAWAGDLYVQLLDTSGAAGPEVDPGGVPTNPAQRVLAGAPIANSGGNASGLLFGEANAGGTAGPHGATQGNAFARVYLIAGGSGAAGLVPGTPYFDSPLHPVNTAVAPIPQGIGFFAPPADDFTASGLDTPTGTIIPEPSVMALLGIGMLTVWLRRRR